MSLTRCDSKDARQKWQCEYYEDYILWGVSIDSPNITHAVRYYRSNALSARNIRTLLNDRNTWTLYPTKNRSVCSNIQDEGTCKVTYYVD